MLQYFNVESLTMEPMPLGFRLGEFLRFDFTSFPELPVLLPADPVERKSWQGTLAKAKRRLQQRAEAEADAWRTVEAAVEAAIRKIEDGEQPSTARQPRADAFLDCGIDADRVVMHAIRAGQLLRMMELPPDEPICICRNKCGTGDQE